MADSKEKPITDEIAGVEKDIFRDYLGKTLLNPDKVLKSESGGKGIKLYEDLLHDSQVRSNLQTRRLAVVGKEWEVVPASEDDGDIEIAEYVEDVLKGFNFDAARVSLLSAIVLGFKVGEIMWEYSEGDVWVKEIIGRASRRFVFDIENNLRLVTFNNIVHGEPLPDKKFIVFRNISNNGSPYGAGLGSSLYWPVWFKKNAIKFWMIFADKFGSPTAIGKYPQGTTKEQQEALLSAIEAIQQESAIKIPDNMLIELLEASRSGTVNTYETLCNFMNAEISKIILGQTLTTEIGQTGGAYSASQTHEEIRQDYIKADADSLCECLNNSLIRWIVDYNFGSRVRGQGSRGYPNVWIRTEDEKDLKPLAERDKIIYDMGFEPEDETYINETYGGKWKRRAVNTTPFNPPLLRGNEGVVGSQQFVEKKGCPVCMSEKGQEKDTVDNMVDRLMDEADLDPMIDVIKKFIEDAKSMEELRDRLLEAYSDMDAVELGNLMQKAFTAAEMMGRFEA